MSKKRIKIETALERYLEACLLNDQIGNTKLSRYHCDQLREQLIRSINPKWTDSTIIIEKNPV